MKKNIFPKIAPVFFLLTSITVLLSLLVILANNPKTKTSQTDNGSVMATDFLPGKIFYYNEMSGELGKFNPDRTINLKWGRDYVGENDTRPNTGTCGWTLNGNILTIENSAISDGRYNLEEFAKEKVGDKMVLVKWYGDEKQFGFFIADDLETLNKVTDVGLSF